METRHASQLARLSSCLGGRSMPLEIQWIIWKSKFIHVIQKCMEIMWKGSPQTSVARLRGRTKTTQDCFLQSR
jgi:hypothetical protein